MCLIFFSIETTSYCHFTSPIRRYADLLVHRALKAQLDRPSGSGGRRGDGPSSDTARQGAGRVSWRERLAIEAERERAVDEASRHRAAASSFVVAAAASQTIQSVDVSDNEASGGDTIAPDVPSAFASVRGSNLLNWFVEIAPPLPVDPLPLPALLALIALVGLALRRKLPSTRAAHNA